MKPKHAILLAALLPFIGGCESFKWPNWWKKEVPVTPPSESGPGAASAPDERGKAPAETGGEDQAGGEQTGPEAKPPTAGEGETPSPPSNPPAKGAPGRVGGPTHLTSLAGDPAPKGRGPGAEPLDDQQPFEDDEPDFGPEAASKPAPGPRPQPVTSAPAPKPTPEPVPETGPAEPAPKPKPQPRPQPKPGPEPAPKPQPPVKPAPKIEPVGPERTVAGSILQVNEHFITVEDVLHSADGKLSAFPATVTELTFRRQAAGIISEAINNKMHQVLILAEAEKRLTEDQQKLIDAEMAATLREMLAEVGGSRTKLEQQYADRGSSLNDVIGEQRKQLVVHLYLQGRFLPAVTMNRPMLWDYYTKHKQEFSSPKKVQMQIIFVSTRAALREGVTNPTEAEIDAARSKAKEKIDAAAVALMNQEDFAKVARTYSDGIRADKGGLWPLMATGNFRAEEVEAAAFELPEGKVSGVIETETGFWIVKANRVQPGRQVSFEDAQEEITEKLRDEQLRRLENDYLKRLIAGATIIQSDGFLKVAVDRAVDRYWGK